MATPSPAGPASSPSHRQGENAERPRTRSTPATQASVASSSAEAVRRKQTTCAPRCIPIYVRIVQKDIWLRIHVDMRSTIGAVKDAVLIKAGAPDYDPALQPYFYEEASKASADAKMSMGPGETARRPPLAALPKAFMARRPREPPAPASAAAQESCLDGYFASSSKGIRAKGFPRDFQPSSTRQITEQNDVYVSNSPPPAGQLPRLARARASFSSLTTAASRAAQLGVGSSSSSSKDSSADVHNVFHKGDKLAGSFVPSLAGIDSRSGSIAGGKTADTVLTHRLPALQGNEDAKRMEEEALARAEAAMARWPLSTTLATELFNGSHTAGSGSGPPRLPPQHDESFRSITSSPSRTSVDVGAHSTTGPSSPSSLRPGSRALRGKRFGSTAGISADSWNEDDSDDLDFLGVDTSDGDSSQFSGFDSLSDMTHALSAFRSDVSSHDLTTSDTSRLWGTQLEEALALEQALRRPPRIDVDLDHLDRGNEGTSQMQEVLQSPEEFDLSAPAIANRRRSGTVTNATKGIVTTASGALGLAVVEDEDIQHSDTVDGGGSISLSGASRGPHSRSTTRTASDSVISEGLLSSGDSRQMGGGLSSSSQPSLESDEADGTGSSKLSTDYVDVAEGSSREESADNERREHVNPMETTSGAAMGRLGGINQDEISVWQSAQHPLSSSYCVFSFANGHLLEDWRTVASFRVRPFELFEIQNASIVDRINLPRGRPGVAPTPIFVDPHRGNHQQETLPAESSLPRVGNTLHQKPAALSVDERYAESYMEGWFYVHKVGSGPSKLLKAGLGVWKLRWIVVRGWRLTVYRKRPRRDADTTSSTSVTLAWHLGTIKWITEEEAEGRTNPPLPPKQPVSPQMIVVAFSTAATAPLSSPNSGSAVSAPSSGQSITWTPQGTMMASVTVGTTNGLERDRERENTASSAGSGLSGSSTIAIRCITSLDHSALHRLLMRAHYRYALGRADALHGVEVETWRRTAILRATIAGRGGVVQPGRRGRKDGRNAFARTRLRPAGVSQEWDDADCWSDREEEEQIIPRALR